MKRLKQCLVTILALSVFGCLGAVQTDRISPRHTDLVAEGSEPIPEPLPIPPLIAVGQQPRTILMEGSEPIPEPLPIPPFAHLG